MKDKIVEICQLSADAQKSVDEGGLEEAAREAWAAMQKYFAFGGYVPFEEIRGNFQEAFGGYDWKTLITTEVALRRDIEEGGDFTFYLDQNDADEALWERLFAKSLSAPARPDTWRARGTIKRNSARPPSYEGKSSLLDFRLCKENAAYRYSYDSILWLWEEHDGTRRAARGRAIVCRTGTKWSITFRKINTYPEHEPKNKKEDADKEYEKQERKEAPTKVSGYLNKSSEISALLFDGIFGSGDQDVHGLIAVTGRTGSLKSVIVKELVDLYLKKLLTVPRRRPHLITFEDPIERPFDEIDGCDYTPLERGRDISSLAEAVNNALRQTPAVLLVGETRNPADWETLLNFAGTGHLVITTAHAGSLTEAMGNILHGARASSPADRSTVADRLRAVVHLKGQREPDTGVGFLIPAMWHQTPEGIKALMAEGLSSLLPNTPKPRVSEPYHPPHLPYSVGRFWFVRELLRKEHATKNVLNLLGDIRLSISFQ